MNKISPALPLQFTAPARPLPKAALSPEAVVCDGFGPGDGQVAAPQYAPPPTQAALDLSGSPKELVRTIGDHILAQSCITEGLNQAYSPNHPSGMTTRVHIETQVQMMNHLVEGQFDDLHKMVDNPEAPEKLRVSKEDLQNLLGPLTQDLSASDWKVLTVVAGFHDLGKMSPEWADKSGLDLKGVEWIAHDYDSETLLRNNPDLMKPYGLNSEEQEKVLTLSRLHSLPGQYFFGEGNLSAYQPLFGTAAKEGNDSVLKLARAHGALDVMSALNHKLVKPVVDSHVKLKSVVDAAYGEHVSPGSKFRQEAVAQLEKASEGEDGSSLLAIQQQCGLGPVALQRLQKLVGGDVKPHHLLQALEKVGPEFAHAFDKAMDRQETLYGTYVANTFGSGLARALKVAQPDGLARPQDVAEATIKMVVCAQRHRDELPDVRSEWALGAQAPSLVVAAGAPQALSVLEETQKIYSPQQGVTYLTGPSSRLTMRGGETGVEIGWRA